MLALGFQRHLKSPWKLTISSLISFILVVISQVSLTLIPNHFNSSPLVVQLSLSAVLLLIVTGFSRGFRWVLSVSASAPALVLFNILFVWSVHVTVIQRGPFFSSNISLLWSVVFNVECILLVIGFFRILSSDPGLITHGNSNFNWYIKDRIQDSDSQLEEEGLSTVYPCPQQCAGEMEKDSFFLRRVKYCKFCKAYIKGFDHHCPAFGNCIGQKNHKFFMLLLVGFLIVEASYIACSDQHIKRSLILNKRMVKTSLSDNLAISTSLFSLLQVMWQVLFLIWHIYCIFVNIKTDEWINWKKYPEFQASAQAQPGRSSSETQFINPYNKGVVRNIQEFLSPNG